MATELGEKNVQDIYDEEFAANLEISKNLIQELNSSRERNICKKWIRKLIDLKAADPVVKQNRNSFFQYFLQILSKAVYESKDQTFLGDGEPRVETQDYMSRWSADGKTYVAAKPLAGRGTLVYMAVSQNPSLGWEKQGEQGVHASVLQDFEKVLS